MPDWTNYSFGYDTGTSTSSSYFTATEIQQQQYEEYRQRREQQERELQQIMEEHQRMMNGEIEKERQLKEDKRKYPLFFLKEGII